jgi:hypothetical protein
MEGKKTVLKIKIQHRNGDKKYRLNKYQYLNKYIENNRFLAIWITPPF